MLLLVIGVPEPFKFWVGGEPFKLVVVGIGRGKEEEEEERL